MSFTNPRPIAITPGEPAGVGPDIVCDIASSWTGAPLVIVACPELMAQRAKRLGLAWDIPLYQPNQSVPVSLFPVLCSEPSPIPGQLNPAHADYVLTTLSEASDRCLHGEWAALVTGPVHKGVINDAGIPFMGHTEWLQQQTGTTNVLMTFLNPVIPCALLTTHHPLREVTQHITEDRVYQALHLLHKGMQRFLTLESPRLGIAGVNPHAGEGGHLGDEEITILMPAIDRARADGIDCSDPIPADTLFTPPARKPFDAILSMYHDQGLPVIKALAFGQTTQITLGLPFLRVSVDHGTALGLAGTGRANTQSMKSAITHAISMTQHQEKSS